MSVHEPCGGSGLRPAGALLSDLTMAAQPMAILGARQQQHAMRLAFERDGFILIRGIVPQALLRDVRSVVEAAVEQRAEDLLARGLVSSTHSGEPFETRWQAVVEESGAMQARRSWDEDLISRPFHRLCSAPALTEVLQYLLSDEDADVDAATATATGAGAGAGAGAGEHDMPAAQLHTFSAALLMILAC